MMRCLTTLFAMMTVVAGMMIPLTGASALSAAPEAGKPRRLTDADNRKVIKLPVGTAFEIALKGNATTGYQWQAGKIEGEGVRQTGEVGYVQDQHSGQIVGSGGTYIFHFNVAKAAKTVIRLIYVRPWEKNVAPIQTFEVTVDATPGPS
jgi:inhibitor of cysteine peptidase